MSEAISKFHPSARSCGPQLSGLADLIPLDRLPIREAAPDSSMPETDGSFIKDFLFGLLIVAPLWAAALWFAFG